MLALRYWIAVVALGLAMALSPLGLLAQPLHVRDAGPCGKPPPPKPAQRSGSEGIPPLPIPAVPQRRTEKKKPPRPPVLVVKIRTGSLLDWGTDPNDINNLLTWMKSRLKVSFTYQVKHISQIDLDAERPPMLYRTGHNSFSFIEPQRRNLRQYILQGGFIYFDSCCGRKAFADSARKELALIFPERRLEKLAPDDPIYRSYFDVPTVRYKPAAGIAGQTPPPLEGINIGCRTAVVFSPYDLSCGWDMHTHSNCAGVAVEDALKLGANMVAYATATKQMGVSLASSRVFVDSDNDKADKFRIGQVIHNGQWDTDLAGLSTLLDAVSSVSSLKVSFDKQAIKLDSPELTVFPFIYMKGLRPFTLSGSEKAALKAYLQAGGFMFAEACCGRQSFDLAFQKLIKELFPTNRFSRLPPTHSIFSSHYQIGQVKFTQAALMWNKRLRSPSPPDLRGLTLGGHLAVVYSPYGLASGWELRPNPYAVGYESEDAIKIGVNVVMHAITH